MKILVMGAGAVGNYFGARLQQADEDVIFCARGENLRVLREKGLEIQSPRGDIAIRVKATDDPNEFASYDLILFCVKAYDVLLLMAWRFRRRPWLKKFKSWNRSAEKAWQLFRDLP